MQAIQRDVDRCHARRVHRPVVDRALHASCAAGVITLIALGVGANTAIFSVSRGVLSQRERFLAGADRKP